MTPVLYVTFGLPGAGKTFVARAFEPFGFFCHDGDDDLPPAMREAIANAQPINDAMRDEFFDAIIAHVGELHPLHPRMIVAQTFIKEKYRRRFLDAFPHAEFILVEASDEVRVARLVARTHQALDPAYARNMTTLFEPPKIHYWTFDNNDDGVAHVSAQIARLWTNHEHHV